MTTDIKTLEELAKLVRYYILTSTTKAGSGHPTSSMSAAEIMTALFFGGYFKSDLNAPQGQSNDRLIFSKGHAAPLLYALYTTAGALSEKDLMTLREFGSAIEGHPTMDWPYTQVATGSLGQGIGAAVGMALAAKQKGYDYKTFVLLGDSEMAEGSVWESLQIADHYKLDNLIGFVDVNRLGQRGETLFGHDVDNLAKKVVSFGWEAIVLEEGNDMKASVEALELAMKQNKPCMILAKTLKGAGVSFLADKDNWHGKALNEEELAAALKEVGEVNFDLVGEILPPVVPQAEEKNDKEFSFEIDYKLGDKKATREVYGEALVKLGGVNGRVVALDAETSNSTYSDKFKKAYPERFYEMYIAEQNMVSVGLGMARCKMIPFCSSFAAFLTRAYDQIRTLPYSEGNVKIAGSHAGVSIGQDGSSQMALEDLAMTRAVERSTVLYPFDAVATANCVRLAAEKEGFVYIRTTRAATEVIYSKDEEFVIGGSKTVYSSDSDVVTVVAAGITLAEALKAYKELQAEGVNVRIIDLYSVKPVDKETLLKAAKETKAIVVVEDHHREGGLFGAVSEALAGERANVHSLAVTKTPRSGKPEELLEYMEIDAKAIVAKVKGII